MSGAEHVAQAELPNQIHLLSVLNNHSLSRQCSPQDPRDWFPSTHRSGPAITTCWTPVELQLHQSSTQAPLLGKQVSTHILIIRFSLAGVRIELDLELGLVWFLGLGIRVRVRVANHGWIRVGVTLTEKRGMRREGQNLSVSRSAASKFTGGRSH